MIYRRDGGMCQQCGEQAANGHIDHKTPLWCAPANPDKDARDAFWGESNLQWLCVPCHKAKTRAETLALARASRQRLMRFA